MRVMMTWLVLGMGVIWLGACGGSTPDPGSETDIALRGLIQRYQLRGDPSSGS